MKRIASFCLAVGVIAASAPPVQADDQSIYFATGAIGGGRSAAPPEAYGRYPGGGYGYGAYPYRGYAYGAYPSGGYAYGAYESPQSCTYSGGPKSSQGWTCW
jgi:hypothetical protein